MGIRPTEQLILRLAWRNVRRHWRHSLAALGTMVVGFVSLAIFQGYLDELMGSQRELIYSRHMIGEVLVRRPRGDSHDARINPHLFRLDEREQAFLDGWVREHADVVTARMRALFVLGMASVGGSTAQVIAVGNDVAEGRILRRKWAWNTWAGHPLKDSERNGTVLAMGLASILGCEPTGNEDVIDPETSRPRPVERPFKCKQDTLMLTSNGGQGRMNALEAEVVGLTTVAAREYDQRMMWLPLPFVQELAGTRGVSSYMIMLNDPARAPAVRAELRRAAQGRGLDLDVIDWMDTEQADLLRRATDLVAIYRSLVVLIILVIAGAAVLTTMMKTVRERTREVGTLRSLGYGGRHMLAMFAAESAMLALHAGVAGIACAAAATAAINGASISYKAGLLAESIPLRVGYSPAAYAWGFVFLSLVAVVAALLAARKVARMPIAVALADT